MFDIETEILSFSALALKTDRQLVQKAFHSLIYGYYSAFGRTLPWRYTGDPYHVFISEIMLQQTQVDRVVQKYLDFIARFPSFVVLAEAEFNDVLMMWHGLGYNRRAMNLQKAAQTVVAQHNGILPSDPEELIRLPGIGKATAASIAAFGFDKPTVFLETNIRTVYITLFFADNCSDILDDVIVPIAAEMLDTGSPSRWYNALMDLGTYLKKTRPNPTRRSREYSRQSPFHGSKRQLRGLVLKELLEIGTLSKDRLYGISTDDRLNDVIDELTKEGFIAEEGGCYMIRKETKNQ